MAPKPLDPAEHLLLRDANALHRLARNLVGPDAADDVVQSALTAALTSPTRSRRHTGLWLRGVVHKLALLTHRRDARRRVRERTVACSLVDDRDPASLAQQAELIANVAVAVRELEEPFRSVIVLRFWHGLLPEQIATKLAVPRNTVRSRLQRGLERLRARLDRNYGERQRWAAPLGTIVSAREGVTAALAGSGVALFVGMMMQTKLLVGAVAVLVIAVAIPWSSFGEQPPPAFEREPAGAITMHAEPAPRPNERLEVPTPPVPGAEPMSDDSPSATVTEWSARFLVTDENDLPVADATIQVWAGPELPKDGKDGTVLSHAEHPILQVPTGADGRASAVFDRRGVAVAARKGDCRTGDTWLLSHVDADAERVFVLQVPVLQRGTVWRVDGTPAVGAVVHVNVQGWSSLQRGEPPEPAPVTADAAGRFVVPLQFFGVYAIDASLGDERTFRDAFEVRSEHPPDLRLTFPGAITIAGVVVDPAGAPVAGANVHAWREYHLADPAQDANDMETVDDKTGPDGRFAFEVRQYRRYQLIASAGGSANSDVLWVEPSAVRPHPEVRLSLRTAAAIRGVVLAADGSAIPGARVRASAEAGSATRANAVPSRAAMFGEPSAAITDRNGNFALSVHPGTTWQLQAFPVPGASALGYRQVGVQPGRVDIEFRLSEAQVRGCDVRGEVVRADDGRPVENFDVELIDLDDPDAVRSRVAASRQGNRFELATLPLGRSCALVITPRRAGERYDEELAPVRVEPFLTSTAPRTFVVRVSGWATLPVRVLEADDTPARGVHATLLQDGFQHVSWQADRADRDGRLVLAQRMPGAGRLAIWRRARRLCESQITILGGPNPELVIHVPPR
ncbi:MAG TPA: sigma-70 family RNA polymerase sigma factor [Planctomycetota bacterium]|nr:sigma-70 family RNA polymerase sigma factor [Planctomycetota bacterium]